MCLQFKFCNTRAAGSDATSLLDHKRVERFRCRILGETQAGQRHSETRTRHEQDQEGGPHMQNGARWKCAASWASFASQKLGV